MAIIEKPDSTHKEGPPAVEAAGSSGPARPAEGGLAGRVAGVTLLLAVLTLLGKAIGFLRQVVVAGAYGTGSDLDAYLVAAAIPDMAATMALFVSLNLFLPLYTSERERSPESAGRLAAAFLARASLLLLGVSCFLVFAAGAIVTAIAPELDPRLHAVATESLRLLAFLVLFRGVEGTLRGLLHAHRRFALPGVAGLFMSLVIVLCVLGFSDRLGVLALGWGTLLGYLLPLLIILPLALAVVPALTRLRAGSHPLLGEVKRLVPWVVAIEAASLLLPIIDRSVASRFLPSGRISALSYGRLVSEVPFDLVGITLATTLFPEFAALHARGDVEGFRRILRRGIRATVAVMLPVSALLVVLSRPVTRAIFERGAFDAQATGLTGDALWAFSLGLPFLCAAVLVTQAAYAARKLRRILAVKLVALVLKIGISLVLLPVLGHAGIALGSSVFFAVVLVGLLPVTVGGWRGLVPSPPVLLAATAVAAVSGWGLTALVEAAGVTRGVPFLGAELGIWAVAALVYFGICRLGRVEEILWVERLVVRRIFGKEGGW